MQAGMQSLNVDIGVQRSENTIFAQMFLIPTRRSLDLFGMGLCHFKNSGFSLFRFLHRQKTYLCFLAVYRHFIQ